MNRRMDEAKRNPSPGVEGGPSSDSTAAAAAAAAADRIVPVQSVGLLGLEAVAAGRPSTGNSTGSTTTTSNGDKAPSETKQQDQQQKEKEKEEEEEEQTSCAATTNGAFLLLIAPICRNHFPNQRCRCLVLRMRPPPPPPRGRRNQLAGTHRDIRGPSRGAPTRIRREEEVPGDQVHLHCGSPNPSRSSPRGGRRGAESAGFRRVRPGRAAGPARS